MDATGVGFSPPDFGGGHRSDPWLHVGTYSYYSWDTTLGNHNKFFGSFPPILTPKIFPDSSL